MNAFLFVLTGCLEVAVSYDLTLLHVNDIHVRMDETNKYSSSCKDSDSVQGRCFGGISRLHSLVKELREGDNNVLWVNAGDFYQGTVWYTQFKWKVVSKFNNMLNFDATTLGNHEFDDKIAGLTPFLKEQKSPVVVTNINHTLVPELENLYVKSLIKEKGGRRIGIVGYVTPETKQISNPENLIFLDEIEALTQEVERLHNDGVDIIIALGHSGYTRDLEVARLVPHLDVIVGGHSHSFLYTETEKRGNPGSESIRGPYPTLINNTAGGRVLVVQAYAFTKYLGRVELSFSGTGDLEQWQGEPILLDFSVNKDPEMERELDPWRQNLTETTRVIVAQSSVLLNTSRDEETNLGNLVTDIMVWNYRNRTSRGEKITLGLANSGGIRTSIEAGNITKGDLLSVFPFHNTFDLITLTGATLLKVLEHGVGQMNSRGEDGGGRFPQVSGFKIIYDLRKSPGSRLVSAKVVDGTGSYSDVRTDKLYSIVTTDYMARGGDGYDMIPLENKGHLQGFLDTDVISEYFKLYSPINATVQGRIIRRTERDAVTSELIQPNSGLLFEISFGLLSLSLSLLL